MLMNLKVTLKETLWKKTKYLLIIINAKSHRPWTWRERDTNSSAWEQCYTLRWLQVNHKAECHTKDPALQVPPLWRHRMWDVVCYPDCVQAKSAQDFLKACDQKGWKSYQGGWIGSGEASLTLLTMKGTSNTSLDCIRVVRWILPDVTSIWTSYRAESLWRVSCSAVIACTHALTPSKCKVSCSSEKGNLAFTAARTCTHAVISEALWNYPLAVSQHLVQV